MSAYLPLLLLLNLQLTRHSRDLPFDNISELPNIYTSFRKSVEPLRDQPRSTLPAPTQLPPLPPDIPPQQSPFRIPTNLDDLLKALLAPLEQDSTFGLVNPPKWPGGNVESAHPFTGGESHALDRISFLISSGAMSSYKATRNGMLGRDFSTKLSAYLAQGHCTARQVHWAMKDFEEGKGAGKDIQGYGHGENDGTTAVRFELLWRDYMHLCMRKFGPAMFHLYGIRPDESRNNKTPPPPKNWRKLDRRTPGNDPAETREVFCRFRSGRTGVGLIDASNRELFLTGYTSNRARQNVASFLASHLEIDWRIGAEWYECMLTDYDAPSNWGNWQYVSGVGNDPRQGRVFNPVKQAMDYDPQGEYIKAWVPELRGVKLTKQVGPQGKEEIDKQRLLGLYQANKLAEWEKESLGLKGVEWVERPLVNINFSVGRGRGGPGRGGTRPGRGGGGGPGRGGYRGGQHQQHREYRRGANEVKQHVANGPTIVSSQ
jgi:deoxyribodipyrimidine photo-lyase